MPISEQEKAARAERKRRRAEIRKLPTKATRRAARLAMRMETPVYEAYRQRDEVLRELGFASYADYLQSELWAAIRLRALRRYRFRCHICHKHATCVHHRTYDRGTLLGKCGHALVALCHKCHHDIEFDENGRKRHWFMANRAIFRMRREWNSSNSRPNNARSAVGGNAETTSSASSSTKTSSSAARTPSNSRTS